MRIIKLKIKNRIIILLCLLIANCTLGFTQIPGLTDSTIQIAANPKYALKLNLLSVIDYVTPSVQFAFEYRIKENINLQTEIGYINSHIGSLIYNHYESQRKFVGLRIRQECRFYFRTNNWGESFYWAPEVLFKTSRHKEYRTFARHHQSYFEEMEFDKTLNILATHIKIGAQTNIFNSQSIIVDYFIGLGVRLRWSKENELPDDAENLENFDFFSIEDGFYPSAIVGIKLGYAF